MNAADVSLKNENVTALSFQIRSISLSFYQKKDTGEKDAYTEFETWSEASRHEFYEGFVQVQDKNIEQDGKIQARKCLQIHLKMQYNLFFASKRKNEENIFIKFIINKLTSTFKIIFKGKLFKNFKFQNTENE